MGGSAAKTPAQGASGAPFGSPAYEAANGGGGQAQRMPPTAGVPSNATGAPFGSPGYQGAPPKAAVATGSKLPSGYGYSIAGLPTPAYVADGLGYGASTTTVGPAGPMGPSRVLGARVMTPEETQYWMTTTGEDPFHNPHPYVTTTSGPEGYSVYGGPGAHGNMSTAMMGGGPPGPMTTMTSMPGTPGYGQQPRSYEIYRKDGSYAGQATVVNGQVILPEEVAVSQFDFTGQGRHHKKKKKKHREEYDEYDEEYEDKDTSSRRQRKKGICG